MIDIPENKNGETLEMEVEKAVEFLVKELGGQDSACLELNHARAGNGEMWVHNDCAARVANLFKDKGYYAHYCYAMNGHPYRLVITNYRTNQDI